MPDRLLVSNPESIYRCFKYVALGDSIASGVGATNNYGYVNYLRDYLETLYHRVDLINHAVSGFTSGKLLRQLKTDEKTREDIKNADVITISIGGENLLDCIANRTNINDTYAANVVLKFIHDWPQIMDEIRNLISPKAQIFVLTVYNPLTGSDPNYNRLDSYIQQINYVISNLAYRFTYNYQVVDIHEHFQGVFPDGSWKVCTWTHFYEDDPDPNPTNSGDIEIAQMNGGLICIIL